MIDSETIAFFRAAGVFRVKTEEKARARFYEALPDFEGKAYADSEELFEDLMSYAEKERRAKIEREAERERKRAAKKAAKEALPVADGFHKVEERIKRYPAGRYILTVAQNNTLSDPAFLQAMKCFASERGATILIACTTYNKNGFNQPEDNLWYDKDIMPYLVNGHINLDDFAHFIADANVIVTAKNPISGFEAATPAGVHTIVPASKIGLKVTAALKGGRTKIVTSTGAATMRNYILRKAGTVAAFEHNIGAVYVDTIEGVIRHVERMGDDHGFYDIDGYYSANGFVPLAAGDIAALQPGDIHAEKLERNNLASLLSLIDELKPESIVLHDVMDFSSRNHHNIKDAFFIHKQTVANNTVSNDLNTVASVILQLNDSGSKIHVVESNHDLAIETWLKNADWKTDPINARIYLESALDWIKHQEDQPETPYNALERACRRAFPHEQHAWDDINFHKVDESLIIAGVENCHGHNGVNGSRGSPTQFRALGIPLNTGHTHSPSIYGKVYTAGVLASLDMGYNVGASSWAIAHVITYRNGQRQIYFA